MVIDQDSGDEKSPKVSPASSTSQRRAASGANTPRRQLSKIGPDEIRSRVSTQLRVLSVRVTSPKSVGLVMSYFDRFVPLQRADQWHAFESAVKAQMQEFGSSPREEDANRLAWLVYNLENFTTAEQRDDDRVQAMLRVARQMSGGFEAQRHHIGSHLSSLTEKVADLSRMRQALAVMALAVPPSGKDHEQRWREFESYIDTQLNDPGMPWYERAARLAMLLYNLKECKSPELASNPHFQALERIVGQLGGGLVDLVSRMAVGHQVKSAPLGSLLAQVNTRVEDLEDEQLSQLGQVLTQLGFNAAANDIGLVLAVRHERQSQSSRKDSDSDENSVSIHFSSNDDEGDDGDEGDASSEEDDSPPAAILPPPPESDFPDPPPGRRVDAGLAGPPA
jgi:hypothetical protein